MPDPFLQLDTVQDAMYEENGLNRRLIRTGYVDGYELNNEPGGTDPEALSRLTRITGMPQYYTPLSSDRPDLILTSIGVRPSVAKFRRAIVTLTYATLPVIPTIYSVQEDAYDEIVTLDYIPGINKLLVVTWQDPPPAPGTLVENLPTEDAVSSVLRPAQFRTAMTIRSVTVTAMRYGAPSAGTGGNSLLIPPSAIYGEGLPSAGNDGEVTGTSHNYVNDAPWPTDMFSPLPKGYWRMARVQTNAEVYEGYHIVRASAYSRQLLDWSSVDRLVSPWTGQPLIVDSTDFQAAMALDYDHGVIAQGNGFLRVGHYPLTSFYTLFGF